MEKLLSGSKEESKHVGDSPPHFNTGGSRPSQPRGFSRLDRIVSLEITSVEGLQGRENGGAQRGDGGGQGGGAGEIGRDEGRGDRERWR